MTNCIQLYTSLLANRLRVPTFVKAIFRQLGLLATLTTARNVEREVSFKCRTIAGDPP